MNPGYPPGDHLGEAKSCHCMKSRLYNVMQSTRTLYDNHCFARMVIVFIFNLVLGAPDLIFIGVLWIALCKYFSIICSIISSGQIKKKLRLSLNIKFKL